LAYKNPSIRIPDFGVQVIRGVFLVGKERVEMCVEFYEIFNSKYVSNKK